MNGLIGFPLTIIILFMVVATAGGGADFAFTQDFSANSSMIVNGTSSNINIPVGTFTFAISATQGAIAVMMSIIVLGSLIGIRVMGSGILGMSAEIIVKGAFYFALWGLFSVFAQPLIAAIPIFGILIYLMLTIMYIIGFVQNLSGGPAND
ncbi:MAG: hypothetical protein ABFD50_13960 [Smithella sp.]